MIRTNVRAAAALLVAIVLSAPAAANPDPLRKYLSGVADDLARFLKGKNQTAVAVAFTGPPQFKSASAGVCTQVLTDLLKERGITVGLGTTFAFNGTFAPGEEADPMGEPRTGIVLKGDIVDVFGTKAAAIDFGGFIDDERKFAELFGASLDLQRQRRDADRDRVKKDALVRPAFFRSGGVTKAGSASPFAVGVEVDGRPRPAQVSRDGRLQEAPDVAATDGLPFVRLDLGDEYKIKLVNDSDFEVAVAVAVDGLSVFHFSEDRSTDPKRPGEPKWRHWIIPAGQSFALPGWHKRDSRVVNGQLQEGKLARFTVAPYEESEAAKLGKFDQIGTITATFHACWEEGRTQPPPDEVPAKFVYTEKAKPQTIIIDGRELQFATVSAETRVGTKMGQEESFNAQGVKRVVGRPRASVTLRYERPTP